LAKNARKAAKSALKLPILIKNKKYLKNENKIKKERENEQIRAKTREYGI
jgi:hypothetical protein